MPDPDQLLIHKVMRRLIPFCMICYLINYIDRVNVSIAKLKMASDIHGFNDSVYSAGAAIFFVGYFLFELPSNLIQQRVGPRRWIARIMITWGIISICFMLTRGPYSFYLLRFLLGLAEAGFFPGVILYLSYWVPHDYRARVSALFLTSTAISGVIGNPLGGFILYFTEKHPLYLQSWQWLFLIEGIPAIILGLITLLFLTDRPANARWLTDSERDRLTTRLARERAAHPGNHTAELKHAFASPFTWILAILYLLIIWGFYTINFYTPTIIKQALIDAGTITAQTPDHLMYLWVGLISAIPFSAAAVGMVLIGRHSDKHNERKYHVLFTCSLTVLGLGLAGLSQSLIGGNLATILTIVGLSIGAIGGFGMFGPFWALPPQLLTGTAAAASFAIINSIGNLAGFFGPMAYPHLTMQNSLFLAAFMGVLGALLVFFTPIPKHRPAPIDLTSAPNPVGPQHVPGMLADE